MRVFYEPTEFECLKPIVDNKDTIVEELNACRNEDMFFNFCLLYTSPSPRDS